MGLFDVFGKNELKEKIELLEKEKQSLLKEMQIKQEEYQKKLSQYKSTLKEKDDVIEAQEKKIYDLKNEISQFDKFKKLCIQPKKVVLDFEEQIYDSPYFLEDLAAFEDLCVEFDCLDELLSVYGTIHNNTPWIVKVWATDIRIEHNNDEMEEIADRKFIGEIAADGYKDIDFYLHQNDLDQILEPYHDELDYYEKSECCKKIYFKFELECDNCRIGICDFTIADSCINIVNYEELCDEISDEDIRYHPSDILYIYKGSVRCHRQGHHIIQVTAVLHNKTDNEIELNVEYCTECKKFILEYTVFEQYRNRYGVLVGNFRMVVNGEFDGEYDLAEESPLMLSGYNVSQRDGYTSQERRYILARIIHDGIMEKGDVIRYLSYFIRKNGAKRGNELALSKWEEDLAFVQGYNKNIQPRAIITDIKKY